jgi:hypothetical protein
MTKSAQSSYQPLGVRDRLKLQKAIRALRSPFHSVRVAAAKEIHKILHKTRGIKRRLHERAVKPAVRKVTPKRLHKTLGVHAREAQAPRSRGHGTPIAPQMPRRGFTPPGGHNQTRGDLKARARAMKNGKRAPEAPAAGQERQQAPRRDLLDDAGLRPRPGEQAHRERAKKASTTGQDLKQAHDERRATELAEHHEREAAKDRERLARREDQNSPYAQTLKREIAYREGERDKARAQQQEQDRPMPRGRDPRPDGAQKGVTRRGPDKAASNGHAPPLPADTIREPSRARTR